MVQIQSIRRLANRLAEKGSEEHQAIMALLVSLEVGPDVSRIAALTGIDPATLEGFGRNLDRSGVWREGRVDAQGWFDEKHGTIALVMDAMVAIGEVVRVQSAPSTPVGTQPRPHLDAMPINPYARVCV